MFRQYEYIAVCAIFIFLTTTCTLIFPFINIYTTEIDDITYTDPVIAILMVIITSVEMLHIPSGHLINMSGEFKISKNIQIIACTVLIIAMAIGGNLWGIYGMFYFTINTIIAICISWMCYRTLFMAIFRRINVLYKGLIKR